MSIPSPEQQHALRSAATGGVVRAYMLLVALLIAPFTGAHAESDEKLVDALESARDRREHATAVQAIHERLESGPISDELSSRIVAALMARQIVAKSGQLPLVRELHAANPLGEASINALARGLSGDVVQGPHGRLVIREVLVDHMQRRPLTALAFIELENALEHRAMLNRAAALEVLSELDRDDARWPRVVKAVARTLSENAHQHTRSTAIQALARLADGEPLQRSTVTLLIRVATIDPYMSVRVDALELLVQQPLESQRRREVAHTFARSLGDTTSEPWRRSKGLGGYHGLHNRAVQALHDWFAPALPEFVVDALIDAAAQRNPKLVLELLTSIRERDALSEAQRTELERVAAAHSQSQIREAIYRITIADLAPGAMLDEVSVMERARSKEDRLRAAYQLRHRYADRSLPPEVAAAAVRVLTGDAEKELKVAAAELLIASDLDSNEVERHLIDAIRDPANRRNYPLHKTLIAFYGTAGLQQLVSRYADDVTLDESIRTEYVHALASSAGSGDSLSTEARNALVDAAHGASSYVMIDRIERALTTYDAAVPLIVKLKLQRNQSGALFVALALCALINVGCALLMAYSAATMPLAEGMRVLKRTSLWLLFLAMVLVALATVAFGLLGFIGHSYTPAPPATLKFNIPLYVATLIHVLLAALIFRWARQRHRAAGVASSSYHRAAT